MIIVAATIDFADHAARDRAIDATRSIQQATRDDEPGCLAYCFAPDPCDDLRIQVYELWVDEASLEAHFHHDNYHEMRTTLGEHGITAAANRKFLSVRDEPVYDDTRTPRADFFAS